MSKNASKSPFVASNGVEVARQGGYSMPTAAHFKQPSEARNASVRMEFLDAWAEFIEAERTGWHWSNDEHTEARNGRWTMRDDGPWVLHHDDFIPEPPSIAPYWTDATVGLDDRRISAVVRPVIDSFHTWRTEQEKPTEIPGGLSFQEIADNLESVTAAIRTWAEAQS